ncbi:hypothetical protein B0F90DRAFT_1771354, partial [Multifurca ochricompacta]
MSIVLIRLLISNTCSPLGLTFSLRTTGNESVLQRMKFEPMFGHTLMKPRNLFEERDVLLSQIQGLPKTLSVYCFTWTGHHYQSLPVAFQYPSSFSTMDLYFLSRQLITSTIMQMNWGVVRWVLYSRTHVNLSANWLSTSSRSSTSQNNPEFGFAQHQYSVLIPFMP